MKQDKVLEIESFAYSQTPLLQKAKRYEEDVKYLLRTIRSERKRHSDCEEDMLYSNPAEVSKVMRLELLDNIVDTITREYNRNPFIDFGELDDFMKYSDALSENNSAEKRTLGKIFSLLIQHFNRPSPC